MKFLISLLFAMVVSAAPSCTLTASGLLYSGAEKTGGYTAGAGFSITASCTGNGAITYLWTNISGPVTPSLSGATTITVTVSGNSAFGSYIFNLAATDIDGTSNTTKKIGTVIVSANGNIDLVTELGATYGAKVEKLIGPLRPVGSNSAPWYDNRHKAAIDFAWAQYGADPDANPIKYGPYWRVFQTGTVTLTGGADTVTGSGTSLKTYFCGGGTSPTREKIWVQYTNTDGQLSYYIRQVASCETETSITLGEDYPNNASRWGALPDCDSGCAGLSFGGATQDGTATQMPYMVFGGAPGDYYDGWGVAPYAYYFRSGDDTYLGYARTWMTDWFENPAYDHGTGCIWVDQTGGHDHFWQPRQMALYGLGLWALDQANEGDTLPLTQLRRCWQRWKIYLDTYIPNNGLIDDQREDAYLIDAVALCAIIETNTTERDLCRDALVTVSAAMDDYKTDVGSGVLVWNQRYYGSTHCSVSALCASGDSYTASLTNGSTSGTLVGGLTFNSGSELNWYGWFWTTDPHTYPSGGGGGADSTYYQVIGAGTSTITLDRPYEGSTGSKGFSIGHLEVGNGAQPFMQGLLIGAFDRGAKAVDGYDNTVRDLFRSFVVGGAKWQKDYGYNVASTGMYTYVTSLCGHPIPTYDRMCGTNVNGVPPDGIQTDYVSARRTLSAESLKAVGLGFLLSGDVTLRTFGDLIYSEMFDKPGTGGRTSDSLYISDWDDGGFYISATGGGAYQSVTGPKWVGQFFGHPLSGSVYPALRGLDSPSRISGAARTFGNARTH